MITTTLDTWCIYRTWTTMSEQPDLSKPNYPAKFVVKELVKLSEENLISLLDDLYADARRVEQALEQSTNKNERNSQ